VVRKHAAPLAAALVLAFATAPALAQRDRGEAEVERLIEQLQPGTTRGIRVPAEPAPARPATDAPKDRIAAPARPASPPRAQTTAPDGVPAVSITVLFATGSATLTPQAERDLDALGRALASAQLAPYRFRVEGHTDTVGSRAFNDRLGMERARVVAAALAARGVAPLSMQLASRGELEPVVETADEVDEPRNRRVEVWIR